MLTYFLLWFPMLLLAILNGAVRDLGYKKSAGDLAAHQISTVSLILLFSAYIAVIFRWYLPRSEQEAIYIGILWCTLTLAFEFGFGRFRGNSWNTLLADYNILKGRMWIFIPLWVLIVPYIFYRWMK